MILPLPIKRHSRVAFFLSKDGDLLDPETWGLLRQYLTGACVRLQAKSHRPPVPGCSAERGIDNGG